MNIFVLGCVNVWLDQQTNAGCVCAVLPLRIRSSWHRRKSQILTVPSSEHVANLLSVGEKLDKREIVTVTLDSDITVTSLSATSHTLNQWPNTSNSPLGVTNPDRVTLLDQVFRPGFAHLDAVGFWSTLVCLHLVDFTHTGPGLGLSSLLLSVLVERPRQQLLWVRLNLGSGSIHRRCLNRAAGQHSSVPTCLIAHVCVCVITCCVS